MAMEGRFGAGIAAAANGVFLGQVHAYQHPLLRPPEGGLLYRRYDKLES